MFQPASGAKPPRLNERLRDAAASGSSGLAPWGLLLFAVLLGGTGDPKLAAAAPSIGALERHHAIAPAPSAQKKIFPTTQCDFGARSESHKTAISGENISPSWPGYPLDIKTQLNKLS